MIYYITFSVVRPNRKTIHVTRKVTASNYNVAKAVIKRDYEPGVAQKFKIVTKQRLVPKKGASY